MKDEKKSALESFKELHVNKAYQEDALFRTNPGVTKRLLYWLNEQEFPREQFLANDPLISQKLLIREGIEMVLRRLEQELRNQEGTPLS